MPKTPRFSAGSLVRAAGLFVGGLALSLSLTACEPTSHPGAAAVVGGQEISERDVTEAIDELQPVMGQEVTRIAMVNALVASQMYMDAASDLGIEVTEQQFDDEMAPQLEALGADPSTLGHASRLIFEPGLVMEYAATAGLEHELAELAAEVPFEINPRYGSGNPLVEGMSLAEPLADSFR